MAIFNFKEETEMDKFIKQVKDKDTIRYLKSKEYKKYNVSDEWVANVLKCLLSMNETTVFGDSLDSMLSNIKRFYDDVMFGNSDDPKALEVFYSALTSKGKFIYENFNNSLYRLIPDKSMFLQLMYEMSSNNILFENMDNITQYIRSNKEYLNSDSFLPHMYKVFSMIVEKGSFDSDLKDSLLKENKKRAGIYDIDEGKIQFLDNLVNSAESIFTLLGKETKNAKDMLETIKNMVNSSKKDLTKHVEALGVSIDLMVDNALLKLEDISESHAQSEKDRITLNVDETIRNIKDLIREGLVSLKAASSSLSRSTDFEIKRIQEEGEQMLSSLRAIMNDNPYLKEIIAELTGSMEFLSSVKDLKNVIESGALERLHSGTSRGERVVLDGPINTVNLGEQPKIVEPIPEVIPFFNIAKPFNNRFGDFKRKMANMEKNGEIFHEKFIDAATYLFEEMNPYIWGPTGSGKTYLIRQLGRLLDLPVYNSVLNDSYDVLGFADAFGRYVETPFFKAYTQGGIVILDELDIFKANASLILNGLISEGKEYYFPYHGVEQRHPNFRFIAGGNTDGETPNKLYHSRTKFDESLHQRLIPIRVGYDGRVDEKILGKGRTKKEWLDFLLSFRESIINIAEREGDGYDRGNFTTTDTYKLNRILENGSRTTDQIIQDMFIQTKDRTFLEKISDEMNSTSELGQRFNTLMREPRRK